MTATAPAGDESIDRIRFTWSDFVDRLRAVGDAAIDSGPNDAERLDGLRFLLRQLAYREEQFLEFPRGAKAEFFAPESPTRKLFADCPDTIYRQVSIAEGGVYRITGTRGDSPYISFTAYRAAITDRVVADLHDGELDIADDGTFELTIGGEPRSSNWLDTRGGGDGAAFVIIREYCHDRANGTHATFEIDQLAPDLTHRPELDIDTFSAALGIIGLGLSFSNDATIRLSEELRLRPNQMSEGAAQLVSEMAGTPHNHYQLSSVRLEEGQAVELELDPPACRYWSVHLNNWWLESPEFRDGQSVCINDSHAVRDPDGVIRIRVGPDDPGGGNWLDTKGRRETILLARYLLPEGELPPIVPRVIEI